VDNKKKERGICILPFGVDYGVVVVVGVGVSLCVIPKRN
jgi:hypothetical protein